MAYPARPFVVPREPSYLLPGKGDQVVTDYYAKTSAEDSTADLEKSPVKGDAKDSSTAVGTNNTHDGGISTAIEPNASRGSDTTERVPRGLSIPNLREDRSNHLVPKKPEPRERWLAPVRDLPFYSPKKIGNWTKYILLQGVCRDVVTQKSQFSIPSELRQC